MAVIDFYDDNGAALIAAVGSFPSEILKEASVTPQGSLRDRDVALVLVDTDGSRHRKYACHDLGNTLVSMLYLEQAYALGELNDTAVKVAATNLAAAADVFELEVPEAFQQLTKLAAVPAEMVDERAVIFRPAEKEAQVPDRGPYGRLEETKRQWFNLSPQEKRASAVKLAELSSQVPMTVPQGITRYAGEGLSEKFAGHVVRRLDYVRDPELVIEYGRLSKVAAAMAPDDVVMILYELDNRAGLRWDGGDRYGERIPDPYLCVYDYEKQAAFSWNHGGDHVSEAQLAEFPSAEGASHLFRETFTDTAWLRFQKDPLGTFKAMPLEQKILVSRMARQRE